MQVVNKKNKPRTPNNCINNDKLINLVGNIKMYDTDYFCMI